VVASSLEKRGIIMENRYDILTSVDVLNTLHGGVIEPQVALRQLENSREIRIKAPSIDPESIQVEINNNKLSIWFAININAAGKIVRLPHIIYDKQLPYFIDIRSINSTVEGNDLVIVLPFNGLAKGYHKKIKSNDEQ
jgi:hypothetical protein